MWSCPLCAAMSSGVPLLPWTALTLTPASNNHLHDVDVTLLCGREENRQKKTANFGHVSSGSSMLQFRKHPAPAIPGLHTSSDTTTGNPYNPHCDNDLAFPNGLPGEWCHAKRLTTNNSMAITG